MRYIVSDHLGKSLYWYVHDEPIKKLPEFNGSSQQLLIRYIKDASNMLKEDINILSDSSCVFTEDKERKLILKLKSIIAARKVWQEEESRSDTENKSIC